MKTGIKSIRRFEDKHEAEVIEVWHRAGRTAYTYLPTWQAFTIQQATEVFRRHILAKNQLWVGIMDDQVVAFIAIHGSYIDRMYVDPAQWRKGWGTSLIHHAKDLSPQGLELHTHQENHSARSLYEKHGFKAVKFGISPPPELAPDVEYHWRPSEGNE